MSVFAMQSGDKACTKVGDADLLPKLIWSFIFVSGHRSDNFIVGLTDVSPAITAPMLRDYDVCAQYPGVVGVGATVYLPCTSVMPPRRYLIVQIDTVNEYLNFCEIEVYVRRKLVFFC